MEFVSLGPSEVIIKYSNQIKRLQSEMHAQYSMTSDVSGSRLLGADRTAYTAADADRNNSVDQTSLMGEPISRSALPFCVRLVVVINPVKASST
jgi:hypothetical protein